MSIFDLHPELSFHYHNHNDQQQQVLLPPVEVVRGNGNGFVKEINGSLVVRVTPGRTTLYLDGPGAMKVTGSVEIGG